jgi:hypothetical protein
MPADSQPAISFIAVFFFAFAFSRFSKAGEPSFFAELRAAGYFATPFAACISAEPMTLRRHAEFRFR